MSLFDIDNPIYIDPSFNYRCPYCGFLTLDLVDHLYAEHDIENWLLVNQGVLR